MANVNMMDFLKTMKGLFKSCRLITCMQSTKYKKDVESTMTTGAGKTK